MEPSLSVLLPVENAQATLAATVARILEVLPELTRNFEIAVVDDGSTDATIEVADELVSRYPQVRVVRHAKPLGRAAAIQSGMKHSSGEILFLADDHGRLPLNDLRRLWEAIPGQEIVMTKPPSPAPSKRRDRRPTEAIGSGGSQMLRRSTAERFHDSLADQAALRRKLSQAGCQWHEVPVGSAKESPQSKPARSSPKRPIYLHGLKNFALGE